MRASESRSKPGEGSETASSRSARPSGSGPSAASPSHLGLAPLSVLGLQRHAGNAAVSNLLAPARPAPASGVDTSVIRAAVVQRRPLPQTVDEVRAAAPKRDAPDTFVLSRLGLFHVTTFGDEYSVVLDRQKHPWHARYTARALDAAAFTALVTHMYVEVPEPDAIAAKVNELVASKRLSYKGGTSLKQPPEVEQFFQVSVGRGALEDVAATLGLTQRSERGEKLHGAVRLGSFIDAALIHVARRWGNVQGALAAEELEAAGVSRQVIFNLLTDPAKRRALAHVATKQPELEPLVRWFQLDAELSAGTRKPQPSDFDVLSDAEWARALLSTVSKLKDIVGAEVLEHQERERKHELNERLRPHALSISDSVRFILTSYDPESTVTVNFLGPTVLRGGDKIVNARGETLFLLKVDHPWIIYQNEADKRFYRQRVSGIEQELLLGVFALVAEKTRHVVPMVKLVMRVTGALFPPVGYAYIASNVLYVAGNAGRHAGELRELYENVRTSRRNIERVAPGLLDIALRSGVDAVAAELLDARRLTNVAWDEWLIAALKIVRMVAAKQAAGQFAPEAAESALRAVWLKIKAVLSRLWKVISWTTTVGRPVAVGAAEGKGDPQTSTVTEVANRLAAIGIDDAMTVARMLVSLSPDELRLVVDEGLELQRSMDALLDVLKTITSW